MVHNEREVFGIQEGWVHRKPWMIFHSFHGGTFGERKKQKTYFFHGNLHLDDQSRVALVLQLSVFQRVCFDASALSCLFGARWKENLFVGLVGFELRPRFCAPFPNLKIRWFERF